MRIPRFAVALGAAGAMLTGSVAMAATAVPVKSSPKYELNGEAATVGGHSWFAWTQAKDPRAWGTGWDVLLSRDAGKRKLISRDGAFSFFGGFDDATGDLVYQQALRRSPGNSDLFVYANGRSDKMGSSVNNGYWQCCADLTADWVLYSENRFAKATSLWRVIAYDRSSQTKSVLASASRRCSCLNAGNVDDSLAAWTEGHRVHVWDLSLDAWAGSTSPPPGATDEQGFIVDPDPLTPGDETLYWSRRSRTGCGQQVRILKAPLSDLTNTTTIFPVKAGFFVNSLSVDDTTGPSNLYFGRESCKKVPAGDIFVINGVDSLTHSGAAEPQYVGSGPATRSGASSPEMPRMP